MVLTILTAVTKHTSGHSKYTKEEYAKHLETGNINRMEVIDRYKDYDFTNKYKFTLDYLKVENAEKIDGNESTFTTIGKCKFEK